MRHEKKLLLTETKDLLEDTSSFLITSYQGMDPNVTFAFRMSIVETGGCFQVVKKRMFLKAAAEAGINMDRESLKGHIGIVYAEDDVIATTKAVYTFTKHHKGLLEVLGGVFEGEACSSQEFEEISKLSSQEQMRVEFLGLLEGVMSWVPGIIEMFLGDIISYIDQKKVQKES